MKKVLSELEDIHRICGASRTLLLCANRAVRPNQVWIEAEFLRGTGSIIDFWQGRSANGTYQQLLDDCSDKGRMDLVTHDMPECALKHVYEGAGTYRSIVVSLGHQGVDAYRYLSMNFPSIAIPSAKLVTDSALELSKQISRAGLAAPKRLHWPA